jgi:ABC-type lipoprotein release transport system permease subunit
MLFKLAFRNIADKPLKTAATIAVIALSIAILFCVLSYGETVENYVFAVETAKTARSDITISYRSDGARIADTGALADHLDDFEYCVGALSVYGLWGNDRYVYLRGFAREEIQTLYDIEIVEGSIENLKAATDNVAVSQKTAKDLGLALDSQISVTVMNKTKHFYVAAIAKDNGYFAADSPYTLIGINEGVSRFFGSEWGGFYSEIYIKLKENVSVEQKIEQLKQIAAYQNMQVDKAVDYQIIANKANTLSAAVNVIGGAIVFLALFSIVILFATNAKAVRNYISRLAAVGATKRQVASVAFAETFIYALSGAMLGGALAIGLFKLLINWTLSSTFAFYIPAAKLAIALSAGFFAAMLAGLLPLWLSRRRTVRENLIVWQPTYLKTKIIILCTLLLVVLVSLICEAAIETKVKGFFAVVTFLGVLLTLGLFSPLLLTLVEKISQKIPKSNAATKLAALSASRIQSSRRTFQIMALGVTVCTMLFLAWNVTTTIFTSFATEFTQMALVSNVPADPALPAELAAQQGVNRAIGAVWKKAELTYGGVKKSVSILGSEELLDCIDFEFFTDEATVRARLTSADSEVNYVFLDYSYTLIYGIKEGDTVALRLEDKEAEFTVGGILRHQLFTGNYALIATSTVSRAFSLPAFDTVLLFTDDVDKTVGRLRTDFADRNFFAVGALENFRYELDAFGDVLTLVGVLAFIITAMVAAGVASNTAVSRAARQTERARLLISGMSKKQLFGSEICEHAIFAALTFVVSFGLSMLLSVCMIDALLLLNIYFSKIYAVLPAFLCAASCSAAYIMMPFIARYKRGYTTAGKQTE